MESVTGGSCIVEEEDEFESFLERVKDAGRKLAAKGSAFCAKSAAKDEVKEIGELQPVPSGAATA